jgi:hypothetical protein
MIGIGAPRSEQVKQRSKRKTEHAACTARARFQCFTHTHTYMLHVGVAMCPQACTDLYTSTRPVRTTTRTANCSEHHYIQGRSENTLDWLTCPFREKMVLAFVDGIAMHLTPRHRHRHHPTQPSLHPLLAHQYCSPLLQ